MFVLKSASYVPHSTEIGVAEPSLARHSRVQRSSRNRLKQSAHDDGDACFCEELALLLEHVCVIGVEPDDHPCPDRDVVGLERPHSLDEIAYDVLLLSHRQEARLARRLDPHEDALEVRRMEELEHLLVACEIDRKLTCKVHRMVDLDLKSRELLEQSLRVPPVADEVIVDEEE